MKYSLSVLTISLTLFASALANAQEPVAVGTTSSSPALSTPYSQQPAVVAPQPMAPAPYVTPAPQPQVYYYPPAPKPKKRRKGLMVAGWTLLGTSYVITALSGAIAHDVCRAANDAECRRTGGYLMIPIAGPLVAMSGSDVRTLLLFPFLMQTAGLAMGIAGTVMYVRDGKRNQLVNADGIHLTRGLRVNAGSTPRLDGAALNFSYRF